MNLPRRVHWLCHISTVPSVVEFALSPVELLLIGKPNRRQLTRTKGVSAASKQSNHVHCVLALPCLKSQVRANSRKEVFSAGACRRPPGPTWPGAAATPGRCDADHPAAPKRLHPVQDRSIRVRDHHMNAVRVALPRLNEGSD